MSEYERIYKEYTYGDLVEIIQGFAWACREGDVDTACMLGDKYDPIFNFEGDKYYTLAEAIEAGVDYYEDEDGILQRVDEEEIEDE